jgi:hypothetical protein
MRLIMDGGNENGAGCLGAQKVERVGFQKQIERSIRQVDPRLRKAMARDLK